MSIQEEGIKAEQWILGRFIKRGIKCFQPDAISLENGEYILNEVKHQERFLAPPFDGHGLPLWQIKARLNFQEKTNIRCRLIVKEKESNLVFWQWLDILEKKELKDTNGIKPRRIYNLKSFNKAEIKDFI